MLRNNEVILITVTVSLLSLLLICNSNIYKPVHLVFVTQICHSNFQSDCLSLECVFALHINVYTLQYQEDCQVIPT